MIWRKLNKEAVEKFKSERISCMDELAVRSHFVEQIIKELREVEATLIHLANGSAKLIFDGGEEELFDLKQL